MVGNTKCSVCSVYINMPSTGLPHILGKKHQSLLNKLPFTRERALATICIHDVPSRINNLLLWRYFIKFGDIKNISNRNMKKKSRLTEIEFCDSDVVSKLLSKPHVVHTLRLNIKRHPDVQEDTISPQPSTNTPILNKFEGDSLEEQCDSLISKVELSNEELEARRLLVELVYEIFRGTFHGCSVHPFGSSKSNLGLHGCDLDLFVDLGVDDWRCAGMMQKSLGRGCFNGLPHVPDQQRRVRIGADLLRKIPGVEKIVPITRARVPIVKFKYRPFDLNCDISFHSPMPLRNTELIYTYACIDTNVRRMMMILRIWAKNNDVSGSGLTTKINNYALTMLTIFALQDIQPPLIPTVNELQRLGQYQKKGNRDIVSFWDCSFSRDIELIRKSAMNVSSMADLLKHFFNLYATVDFEEFVISPFYGRLLSRTDFHFGNIPAAFSFYFENVQFDRCKKMDLSPLICLQDPFNLSFNLTRNVDGNGLVLFQDKCREAVRLFETLDETDVLALLLCENLNGNEGCDNRTTFHIFLKSKEVGEAGVVDTIANVLGNGMKFECNATSSEESKSKSCVKCKAFWPTWEMRSKFKKQFDFPDYMDSVVREGYVSDYLIEEVFRSERPSSPLATFTCTICNTEGRLKVSMMGSSLAKTLKQPELATQLVCKVLKKCITGIYSPHDVKVL